MRRGWISSLFVLEAILYLTGFVAMFAFAKEVGRFVQKLEGALVDIREMKAQLVSVDKRLAVVEAKVV